MTPVERALLIERRKVRQRAKAEAGATRHRAIAAARETCRDAIAKAWYDYGRAVAPYDAAVQTARRVA
jgi:hypothetical protein